MEHLPVSRCKKLKRGRERKQPEEAKNRRNSITIGGHQRWLSANDFRALGVGWFGECSRSKWTVHFSSYCGVFTTSWKQGYPSDSFQSRTMDQWSRFWWRYNWCVFFPLRTPSTKSEHRLLPRFNHIRQFDFAVLHKLASFASFAWPGF